jgi:hypothetical protein
MVEVGGGGAWVARRVRGGAVLAWKTLGGAQGVPITTATQDASPEAARLRTSTSEGQDGRRDTHKF